MAQQKPGNVALCPECEGPVRISDKARLGQRVPCHRCGSNLEVVERKPIELALATGKNPQKVQAREAAKREPKYDRYRDLE